MSFKAPKPENINPLGKYFPTSHAFIIGIDQYDHLNKLNNAVNDARGVARVLQLEVHNYKVHPPLLNATHKQIIQLLEETMPDLVQPGDRVLFYFAGHGIARQSDQEGVPEGFLMPRDAGKKDSDRYLPMSLLRDHLESLPSKHFFLVLDCCFSGAFRWASYTKRAGRSFPKKIYKERFYRYVTDPAWQILTSAAYDQEAIDGLVFPPIGSSRNQAINGHSPFAESFIDALTGQGDLIPKDQPDGLITATEMYMYIRQKLETYSLSLSPSLRQTPGLYHFPKHDKGEFVFLSPEIILNLPSYNPDINPFKGLQAYNSEDAAIFFGRDEVIQQLLDFVNDHSITIVTGASGSGKSSLVRAGVLPKFEKGSWRPCYLRPGSNPMQALDKIELDHSVPVILLIDQLEELITQCQQLDDRRKFLEFILQFPATFPDGKLVLTIRSDFEPQFDQGILKPLWQEARFSIPPFSGLDFREIIERPALQRIILFDPPELVEKILKDVQNAPGALPLLSFTMSEMYEKLKERGEFGAFKKEDYEALGGVIGALRTRADELFKSLDRDHQLIMQKIMLRMVSLEGGELAKRSVALHELEFQSTEENRYANTVLKKLDEARLIVYGKDGNDTPFVEPAHDALIVAWGTLWNWIAMIGRDNLLLLNQLYSASAEYLKTNNKKDLWHNNPRLMFVKDKSSWMNKNESAFVQKSFRRKNRNRNLTIIFTLILILSLSGLTLWALIKQNEATENLKAFQEEQNAKEQAELAGTQEAYERYLDKGINEMDRLNFDSAVVSFQLALATIGSYGIQIDSGGAEARRLIQLSNQSRQIGLQYDELVKIGDRNFSQNKLSGFLSARSYYQKAGRDFPNYNPTEIQRKLKEVQTELNRILEDELANAQRAMISPDQQQLEIADFHIKRAKKIKREDVRVQELEQKMNTLKANHNE